MTDDIGGGIVMLSMVVLGVSLRFLQEAEGRRAAAKLKAMISVTATVVRDGTAREVPLTQLVPGDVVKLAAGDMIPADLRLLSCKDLFLDPGEPDRRIVSGREIRRAGAGRRPLAAGPQEHLLSGNERRKRHGDWASSPPREADVSGRHGHRHRRPAGADQLRQGRQPVHLADDSASSW